MKVGTNVKYLVPGIVLMATVTHPGAAGQGEVPQIIGRGDVTRSAPPQPGNPWVPLYQGNGRFGCCYGPWGLHSDPGAKTPYPLHGNTRFMHMQHYARLKFNMDYLLPLAVLYWDPEPDAVQDYQQHQSFYDGTITTSFRTGDYAVTILSWFDPVHRNVAGLQIDAEGDCPAILVVPFRALDVHYDQRVKARFKGTLEADTWTAAIRCESAHSTLAVKTKARMSEAKDGLRIDLVDGRNEVLIAVNEIPSVSGSDSLRDTKTWWHDTWTRTGWLDLPDDAAQKVWVRSLAYILYSYNDDGLGCAPPNGLSGNQWPFHFPQDLSYVHPILLSTGHVEVAKAWVEFWHARLGGIQAYTRRRFNTSGVFMPWNMPYGAMHGSDSSRYPNGYHDPDPPNKYSNAIHNSGYMARMAHETAVMLDDTHWTETYAGPFVRETARFYLSILRKENDGLWHVFVEPSIGQDEYGGVNQRDYLCALFSARYCLEKAIDYGFDPDGRMAAVLRDGLAFPTLLSERGVYYTCEGSGAQDFGKQKHPVQLNPLAFLPLGAEADEPTKKAYGLRYAITEDANRPLFDGWTLGEFILAGARMHDAAGWRRDWDNALPARYADPDWIQFYETSNRWDVSFYVTTHGLFAQAILDTIVSTWWGRLDLAPCIPWSGAVRFGNIRTLLGFTAGGEITEGKGEVRLRATRDTAFEYEGETIILRKGRQTTLRLEPPP